MVRNSLHIKDNIAKLPMFTRPAYGITDNDGTWTASLIFLVTASVPIHCDMSWWHGGWICQKFKQKVKWLTVICTIGKKQYWLEFFTWIFTAGSKGSSKKFKQKFKVEKHWWSRPEQKVLRKPSEAHQKSRRSCWEYSSVPSHKIFFHGNVTSNGIHPPGLG